MTRTLQQQLVSNKLAREEQEKTKKQRHKERLEYYRLHGEFPRKKEGDVNVSS